MFLSAGRTGQINYDVLLATLFLSTAVLLGYLYYSERVLEEAYIASSASCIYECLRISDILIHSKLAVVRGGIHFSNVVNCSNLAQAYQDLVQRGFDGYVSCGGTHFGTYSECKVIRKVIWNGVETTLEVGK